MAETLELAAVLGQHGFLEIAAKIVGGAAPRRLAASTRLDVLEQV